MFSCKEVVDLLSNYLDEQGTPELRGEIEKHLAHCSTCSVLYDSTRKTLKIVTETKSFEIPTALSTRITERIMGQVRRRAGQGSDEKT